MNFRNSYMFHVIKVYYRFVFDIATLGRTSISHFSGFDSNVFVSSQNSTRMKSLEIDQINAKHWRERERQGKKGKQKIPEWDSQMDIIYTV